MQVTYSGKKEVKQEKHVVINDAFKGPLRLVSNVVHYFKVSAIAYGQSLLSFLQLNDHMFISVSSFTYDFTGHLLINLENQELAEHKPIQTQVDLVPVVRCKNPMDLEEWRYGNT